MKKKCAFTICTRSYKGLALTLKNSFLEYNPNFDFFIVYIDEENGNEFESAKKIMRKFISEEQYNEMAFKYDLTEFCTSVKPFVLLHFLQMNYDLAAYFDPDIVFFSKFQELEEGSKFAYITPHIITPQGNEYIGKQTDNLILRCGIYNCGFIAFRNCKKTVEILNWWKDKLINHAYNDPWLGLFTDQKWIDFLPVFYSNEDLLIIKNPGCNFAPWNYFERKIEKKDNSFYVTSRNGKFENQSKLVFIHASGYSYKQLCNGIIVHTSRDLLETKDVDDVLLFYGEKLKQYETESYFTIPYKYGQFSNGCPILKLHRRMLRKAGDEKIIVMNPFASEGKLYKWLKKNKLLVDGTIGNVTPLNTENYGRKYKFLVGFLKNCKKILGIKRFLQFIAGMHKYTREEEVALYIGKAGIYSLREQK